MQSKMQVIPKRPERIRKSARYCAPNETRETSERLRNRSTGNIGDEREQLTRSASRTERFLINNSGARRAR